MLVNESLKLIHDRFDKHCWRRVGILNQFQCDMAVCDGCGVITLLADNDPDRRMDLDKVKSRGVLIQMREASYDSAVSAEIDKEIAKHI